jgi:Zn-dependent peptidase ImmA (M78 family)/O-acetyl-ADP-ribose deacetylase (regulator of RNase III)
MVLDVREATVTWTHPSVRLLTGESEDAARAIAERARQLALSAMSSGWSGPPFDPVALAEILNIPMRPREDIADARLVPVGEKRVVLEFNPNRPPSRMRYSVAHEIAHTLFPDYAEQIRNRAGRDEQRGDDWQLEMLCNIAAAELLMPVGSLSSVEDHPLSIDHVLELRKKYEVSTEAVLRRIVDITRQPCLSFAASRREVAPSAGRYQIDYAVPSKVWQRQSKSGTLIPKGSIVEQCSAIGFTAKGNEEWPGVREKMHVECVGVQPYPTRIAPRVLGLVVPRRLDLASRPGINFVVGDATQPHGSGNQIVAHIVNDRTPTWGAGFGAAVKRKWPAAQREFEAWARGNRQRLVLGNSYRSRLTGSLQICHMIAQHGFGDSSKPRIRYDALEKCLIQLADAAIESESSVHMPRIGTGHAGGMWHVIAELISTCLCNNGVSVTVYDLRSTRKKKEVQHELFVGQQV